MSLFLASLFQISFTCLLSESCWFSWLISSSVTISITLNSTSGLPSLSIVPFLHASLEYQCHRTGAVLSQAAMPIVFLHSVFRLLKPITAREGSCHLNPPATTHSLARLSNMPSCGSPLLYFRKMAMVKGQILLSMLAVNSGSTVQTMHKVSITRLRTSELNWAARWIRPSRMLGRKGWSTCVLSETFSWSQ